MKNYASRFTVVLLVAILINLAFYRLPESIFGIQIKKIDLLSEIRVPAQNDDLLTAFIADNEGRAGQETLRTETTVSPEKQTISTEKKSNESASKSATESTAKSVESTAKPVESPPKSTETPTKPTAESAAKSVEDDKNNTNYLSNKNIEDFSSGHIGLYRFFTALNNIDNLGRPVRIAFVGDSFIEGDIFVADFRAKMQEQFGGRGVGFLPITSVTEQYRPTIKQSANGWKAYSIIKDRNRKYVISGFQFEPTSNNASFQFQMVDMYPGLEEVSSIKFIYSGNETTDMYLRNDRDTLHYKLPTTDKVTQFEMKGRFQKGQLQFKNAKGLKAIGVAFEDNHGIVVDNFSLRGNSGIIMTELDGEHCRNLQHIRPYDLIVLQYGLNVAHDSVRDYGWYRNRMVTVVAHIQDCFPGADILVLGVSDRSHKRGNAYTTMPAVVSLLRAQRQIAQNAEVTFWSIFAAMGGQNSMIKYVNSNWASKDYTHLSFRGGREIANALYDAIITEKGLYEEKELSDDPEHWIE